VGIRGAPRWRRWGLDEWESSRPELMNAGLGDELQAEFVGDLMARGIAKSTFCLALMHTTEVLYGSLWGAADDVGSLRT